MAYNPFYTNGEQFYRYMAYKSEEPEKLTIKNDLFDQFELPGNYGYNPVTGNVLAPANTPEVKEYDWSEMNKLGETHKDPEQQQSKGNISEKIGNVNNKQLLSDTIDKLSQTDPNVGNIKNFLMNTAALESGYKMSTGNKKNSALGWFQFVDKTREGVLNQLGLKLTRDQFSKDPIAQVKAASKLYYNNLEYAKKTGILETAHRNGYSTDDVIHAMWLNPTWAKNFFLFGDDSGKDANGTSIKKYLNMIHGK